MKMFRKRCVRGILRPSSVAAFGLLLTTVAEAQCTLSWLPGMGTPGVSGQVGSMCNWDPDGGGPLPPQVVIAGGFDAAERTTVRNIAAWDPGAGNWTDLGADLVGSIAAVAAAPNGLLYAGGGLTQAGGLVCNRIARWDGSSWAPLGAGTNDFVYAVAALPNGDLVAGGTFTTAGGSPAQHVAIWNGVVWSPLGNGLPFPVLALTTTATGAILATTSNQVWSWQAGSWTQLASGVNGTIECVAAAPSGDLYIGGSFNAVAGVPAANVARWDGIGWHALGVGVGATVEALLAQANGTLFAAGVFSSAGGMAAEGVARWDGTTWSPLGSGIPIAQQGLAGSPRAAALAGLPNGGDVVVGGAFATAGGLPVANLAVWNGSAWSAIGTGINGTSRVAIELPNGDLVVAGQFSSIGPGVPCDRIARRSGGTWSALGTLPGPGTVAALAATSSGDILAAGSFQLGAGGTTTVLRWDGSVWSPLGDAPTGLVNVIHVLANDEVWLGGAFGPSTNPVGLARWNGANWQPVTLPWTTLGFFGGVRAIQVLPNGDPVIGLQLVNQALVARWSGGAWTQLGPTFTGGLVQPAITALALTGLGDLVAGGTFIAVGGAPMAHVARWDGVAWQPLGSGLAPAGVPFTTVRSMTTLPGGDLVVGGVFSDAGGVPVKSLARWDGQSWSPVGDYAAMGPGFLLAPTWLRSGSLVVAGFIGSIAGNVSPHFAELGTTCPANAQPYGNGCAPWPLTSTLPWSGGTWTMQCDGMPAGTLVARLVGYVAQQSPMSAYFANAGPGCQLLLHADAVDAFVTAGPFHTTISLPALPVLAGMQCSCQLLLAGPGLVGTSTATVSTNAVRVTLGHF
jgi:hypothetical protein